MFRRNMTLTFGVRGWKTGRAEMRNDINYPCHVRERVTREIGRIQYWLFAKILKGLTDYRPIPPDYVGQAANDQIRALLETHNPCLVARFGGFEFTAAMRYYDISRPEAKLVKFLKLFTGNYGSFWWDNEIRTNLQRNAGVFPSDDETMTRFAKRALEDVRQVDILGSWIVRELQAKKVFFPNCKAVALNDLNPFLFRHPWTTALTGRKVLVVHPFEESIKSQYARRSKLFADQEVLPDFELITYRPVTSFLGIKTPYENWFEALDKMCADIARIDFDVAIIGCGAYGMSIGAYIKRELHKQAVHLGGVTQMLFGIKGGRWDNTDISRFYNDAWVRPNAAERPHNARLVEEGCYW